MVNLPLGRGALERQYGKTPPVRLINRFFESDPTNLVDGTDLLSRPGTTYLAPSGAVGPVRANYPAPSGTFNDDLFTVSKDKLQRLASDGTRTAIAGTVLGTGVVSMAATEDTLFVADGASLQFYREDGSRASGILTSTGTNVSNTDTVNINGVVYTFKTVLTAAAGDVLIGTDAADSLLNLCYAINRTDEFAGSKFAAATVVNPYVYADTPSALTLTVRAKVGGTAGNAYTTTEGAATLSWGAATLTGGAPEALSGIATPDDVGITSVCVLGGYTFCAAAQDELIYWINPGEIIIDPINRIAAEATPDQIISLMTVGDQFWAFGAESIQPFYLTGGAEVVAPIKGRAFPRGILEGTASLLPSGAAVVVGDDGVVYEIDGAPQRISNHGIEELIRRAREIERVGP